MAHEDASQDRWWDFDEEIERTEAMARHWQRQAAHYADSLSGELIKSIADGYSLQLAALREQYGSRSPVPQESPPLNEFEGAASRDAWLLLDAGPRSEELDCST